MKRTKNTIGKEISLFNLKSEYLLIKHQIDKAISKVLLSGSYSLAIEVENFEKELAAFIGIKYCIGVASGTDALTLALKALDLKKGDGVLLPANVYPSAFGVTLSGVKLQLCDVDPNTLNLSVESLEKVCNKTTKAIITVHLYGNPVNMTEVMAFAKKRKLFVIEDCAQSMGAIFSGKKTGSFGILSCFSFYPTKNLGGYGDGGAILTNSKKLYKRVKSLRMYGEIARYKSNEVGHNSRLDEIQAAILRIKLRYVNRWNEKRRKLAFIYREQLKNLPVKLLKEEQEGKSVYHLFVVYVNRRKALTRYLQKRGILTGIHYPISIHLTEAFKYLKYKRGAFPVSERSNRKILSLPMHPNLRENQVIEICKNIEDFYRSSSTVNS
ncbi:hypothetical protein A3F00_02370 [Candidatus Daviesbacteria bacterium RIFCSPHIGHO2_12_FULL_37_11]|uniref:Erythromycin biosynthesis sensory transduction protein eryC1 n=1 Tax=Candidatus Daviesbacteria bacterium RIFCSPHIGHO2_12_FULL_37_11 TaxID=1797777 RepID=A0A1F5K8H1_9BACT|nr:MAG: hypothetical protein A2769_00215 [Candidatus Daviesbacteria bacterium RIFCSPHIGHO2_01_FULL_37_27]OGE37227.1 MAG: hypothetical protein A3F00_02370 [Candidatus Daviesbacteria bacterium RIFCSPHIGHO2_12_FULL_37_11]OGE46100.1 MAG: hypothetical protein A3B39_00825 [Candidatus Daviesbacteria bacterium RIFCSPLOWO2_01_FULL_37_10]